MRQWNLQEIDSRRVSCDISDNMYSFHSHYAIILRIIFCFFILIWSTGPMQYCNSHCTFKELLLLAMCGVCIVFAIVLFQQSFWLCFYCMNRNMIIARVTSTVPMVFKMLFGFFIQMKTYQIHVLLLHYHWFQWEFCTSFCWFIGYLMTLYWLRG